MLLEEYHRVKVNVEGEAAPNDVTAVQYNKG